MATNRDGEILCVDEVAAWLGLHKNAVYAAAASRRIPCQRFGRRLVFSRDALMAWLAQAGGERCPTSAVPTVREFSKVFIETSRLRNKASTIDAKNAALECHLLPLIGNLRLHEVTYTAVEDLTLALAAKKPTRPRKKKQEGEPETLSTKTVNNILMVLHRMLVVARKRGLIATVPDFEWLPVRPSDFDFLDFDEGQRLIDAATGQLKTMIIVALKTGMRHGELLALRWQDVDLVAGRIMVRQNVVRGVIGTPKSGKAREIAMGNRARAALKEHRHLRGPYVFCNMAGKMLTDSETKNPLAHVVRRAGLARSVGWHMLRHTFASHLAMRGASLKVIQELLGHSTITMTMRYAHLSPRVSREAVRLLDDDARPPHSGAGYDHVHPSL